MSQIIHAPQARTAVLKGMDEIIPNLWLGDILSTYNTEKIQEKGISHVISLVDQPLPQWLRTRYQELEIQHTIFMIQDDELEDILYLMSEACDLVDKTLQNNGVLVHCGLGVSRSGSIVIGYLMRAQKTNRDKVLKFVKSKRPRVQPNAGFWKQLEIWESCNYEIWETTGDEKKEKAVYSEWKDAAKEEMEERVQALGQSKRDVNHLTNQLKNHQLKPADKRA